mmetsp:Transcript_80965/g.217173  ORF Transcript_80965/g.217173 Transcript_80965/m.217173 type:complete len:253 (-) Transcript_80965:452-1210(-)
MRRGLSSGWPASSTGAEALSESSPMEPKPMPSNQRVQLTASHALESHSRSTHCEYSPPPSSSVLFWPVRIWISMSITSSAFWSPSATPASPKSVVASVRSPSTCSCRSSTASVSAGSSLTASTRSLSMEVWLLDTMKAWRFLFHVSDSTYHVQRKLRSALLMAMDASTKVALSTTVSTSAIHGASVACESCGLTGFMHERYSVAAGDSSVSKSAFIFFWISWSTSSHCSDLDVESAAILTPLSSSQCPQANS